MNCTGQPTFSPLFDFNNILSTPQLCWRYDSVIAPSFSGIQNFPIFMGIMLLITGIFMDGPSIGITNLTQDLWFSITVCKKNQNILHISQNLCDELCKWLFLRYLGTKSNQVCHNNFKQDCKTINKTNLGLKGILDSKFFSLWNRSSKVRFWKRIC